MRVGFPGGPRLAWYDRNPASKANHYGQTLAPHTPVTRLSYTVPSGKKAMVEVLQTGVKRITVATTPESPTCYWTLTPNGGAKKWILGARIDMLNIVGDSDDRGIGTTLPLFAGDALDGDTGDTSTEGTVFFFLAYKLTEFDA